jgi:dTDP-4-amino-4,6-dideoxygalactose transaminase
MFPVAERVSARTLSLPLSAGMTEGDVDRVVSAFERILRRAPARAHAL